MSQELIVDKSLIVEEKYKLLFNQLKSLLSKEDNLISNLSNLTAALKSTFEKISWVGFYLFDGSRLYLGPFQGNVACTQIEIGKGVCGTSAKEQKIIIVPDVDKFRGHIACDSDSKSEIVIPGGNCEVFIVKFPGPPASFINTLTMVSTLQTLSKVSL